MKRLFAFLFALSMLLSAAAFAADGDAAAEDIPVLAWLVNLPSLEEVEGRFPICRRQE